MITLVADLLSISRLDRQDRHPRLALLLPAWPEREGNFSPTAVCGVESVVRFASILGGCGCSGSKSKVGMDADDHLHAHAPEL